jgi:mersacidin/lichenicidin family type 2 lantibiotic
MSDNEIIRSWKDEEFRLGLEPAERGLLPANPAGLMELTDEALDDLIAGAAAAMASCCWSSCNKTE